MKRAVRFSVAALLTVPAAVFGIGTEIEGLVTDRLVEPAHVGAKPSFSWRMKSSREGARQTAYRIKVTDGRDGTLWDSGEVHCALSVGIGYAGRPLGSARRYRWTVSVKDELGRWTTSSPAVFSTGLLEKRDWLGARWIAPAEEGDMTIRLGCFRRDAVNRKPVVEAWWTVSAAGVFEIYANGKALDGDFLKPGFTHPLKVRQACTYDVTGMIDRRAGATNVFAAAVSSSWSRDRISCRSRPNRKYVSSLAPALLSVLTLRHEDGSETRVVSDENWLAAMDRHGVKKAGIYEGERVDARTDTGWISSVRPDWPRAVADERLFSGEVRNFRGPPVRLREDLAMVPAAVKVLGDVAGASETAYGTAQVVDVLEGVSSDGSFPREVRIGKGRMLVLDFAQNASAVPELVFEAAEGTEIEIRHAEMLNGGNGEKSRGNDGAAGTPYLANLRKSYAGVKYVCRGGVQRYRSSFTFFGYRYVGVTADGPVSFRLARSLPVTSVNRGYDTVEFETSHAGLNRLFRNCRWGMYSNYLSVPTDCPQRDERVGWTADTQVFAPAAAYLADTSAFLSKWMADMRDSQREDGCYPWIAPESAVHGYTIGWTDAGVIVPYILWRRFGDIAAVEENWSSMNRYMKYVEAKADTDPQPFGDWLAYEYGRDMQWLKPTRVKQQLPRKRFLSYAYRIWIDRMMAEMAGALGRSDEAARYRGREQADIRAFREKCLAADGTILPECDGQCSALYALYLGLLPDEKSRDAVCRSLRENFRAHGWCLQTGFLGTAVLLDAVTDGMGDTELAYTLLLQDKNPSWLYSVDQGATTAWERWDSYTLERGFGPASMNSFNHYAYGAVASWMVSAMAGIRDDPAAAGFRRFVLAPVPDRRVGSVKASFRSPYGTIASAWSYGAGGKWTWTFTVPPNTVATVKPPFPAAGKGGEYGPGTHVLTCPAP